MNKINFRKIGLLGIGVMATALAATPALTQEFIGVNGFSFEIDNVDFYWLGPPIFPSGDRDIPGHYWTQMSPTSFQAQHWNIGPKTPTNPDGVPNWWSSDAPDRSLLYSAEVIIDEWTPEKSQQFSAQGFVHYHELISVADPTLLHPTKVGWFRHTALGDFTLDGGPRPEFSHIVEEGTIDFEFIPNFAEPYQPANVVSLPVPEPSSVLSLFLLGGGGAVSVFLGQKR